MLAYLGAASTHYKNTWSPFDFDVLEFSVGETYQTAYDKAHEVASDKEWQPLVRLFDSFDAHQRKRWRKRAT